MRTFRALMLCLCALLAGCSSNSQPSVQPKHGLLLDGEYHYAPIGWTMSRPWGWNVLTTAQLDAVLGKGRSLMEEATGEEVVDSETHLLYLRYNRRNQFTSSVSDFDESLGTEKEQATDIFDSVLAAYEVAGIPTRSTRGSETIDGQRFELMQVSMLDARRAREVARSDIYQARIGTRWFMTSMATADWLPRQQILRAWRNSEFSFPTEDGEKSAR